MNHLHTLKRQLASIWLSLGVFIRKLPNKLAIALAVIGTLGLIVCGWFMLSPQRIEPVASSMPALETPVVRSLNHSEPTSLHIPKLGVEAKFVSLDLNRDGSMQTPSNGDNVGWYKHAPTPGELGPAIVAGHVDTKAGPAVFARLHQLQPGDEFEITRANGTIARFIVNEVTQYDQDAFPTEAVYGNVEHAGIRLITCGGVYERTAKRYSHNTVVFGSLL